MKKREIEKKKKLIKKQNNFENVREKLSGNAVKLMEGIAKKNNIDINSLMFYDTTYAEYIGDYCRTISSKSQRSMSDEQALESMNKDLIKQLQAVIIGKSKYYNASNAYELFLNVSFYIQSRIAEKYGVETYYDIEESGNIDAINEQNKFETWKNSRIESLEKISKMSRDELLNTYSNPNAMMANAMSLPEIGSKITDNEFIRSGALFTGIYGFLGVSAYLGYSLYEALSERGSLNVLSEELGFKGYAELFEYIDETGIEYLTEEEKNVLLEGVLRSQNDKVLREHGFSSLEEAMEAINASKIESSNIADYNLNIANQKSLTLEKISHYRGFKSFEDAQEYLRLKMGLEEYVVGGGGIQKWTETIDVLNPQDRALKDNLESAYAHFESKLKTFEPNAKVEMINDETLNGLNNEIIANQEMLRVNYSRFFEDHETYYYSQDMTAQIIGDNFLDANNEDVFQPYQSWFREFGDRLVENFDLGNLGFIVMGAVLSSAIANRDLIGCRIKMLKNKKIAKMQESIEKEYLKMKENEKQTTLAKLKIKKIENNVKKFEAYYIENLNQARSFEEQKEYADKLIILAKEVPGANVEKIESFFIEKFENAYDWNEQEEYVDKLIKLAKVAPRADIGKIESLFIKKVENARSWNSRDYYAGFLIKLAKEVPGANVGKIESFFIERTKNAYAYDEVKKWIGFLIRLAREVPGVNVERLEDATIKENNSHCILQFAKEVPGADVKKLGDAMIKMGDFADDHHILRFAKEVPGANVEKIESFFIEKFEKTRSWNVRDYYADYLINFAQEVPGADIENIRDVLKSVDALDKLIQDRVDALDKLIQDRKAKNDERTK